ncbi:MAG: DUF4924 family protein [Bacteroidota bacterium]|nr:DUF4924 family protein [Bacteroidota bacterium]
MFDPLGTKKQDNIAAYIISMWHIEDLMRANGFDVASVEALLIDPLELDEETLDQVREWYVGLIESMKEQGIEESGHLAEVEEVINELEYLHRSLREVFNEEEYDKLYAAAESGIKVLQQQAGENADGPIETCFTAIYGVMVLRAQEKEISESTAEAEGHMRRLLERLSQHYRQMRKLPGVSMN